MILVYGLLLAFLGTARYLTGRRARGLERRYSKAAKACLQLMTELPREGNSGRADAALAAKRQYQLGEAVERRDRLEAKHDRWQERADRLAARVERVRGWRGRKVPYLVGAADMVAVSAVVDYLRGGQPLTWQAVVEFVTQLLQR